MSRMCVLALLLAAFVGGISAVESCPLGSYVTAIVNTSAASCELCPAGRYSDQPGATGCIAACLVGHTWVPTSESYDAATSTSNAAIGTNIVGHFGSGYIDYNGPSGQYITFTVMVDTDSGYQMQVGYALSDTDRPLQLEVSGNRVEVPQMTNNDGRFRKQFRYRWKSTFFSFGGLDRLEID